MAAASPIAPAAAGVPIDWSVCRDACFSARTLFAGEPAPPAHQARHMRNRLVASDTGDRAQRLQHDLMVGPERIALVQDADEHGHDARIALGDERLDDGAPLFAGGGAQYRVHAPRGDGVLMLASARTAALQHARVRAAQKRLQQRGRRRRIRVGRAARTVHARIPVRAVTSGARRG